MGTKAPRVGSGRNLAPLGRLSGPLSGKFRRIWGSRMGETPEKTLEKAPKECSTTDTLVLQRTVWVCAVAMGSTMCNTRVVVCETDMALVRHH